jgi:hypothetical protein
MVYCTLQDPGQAGVLCTADRQGELRMVRTGSFLCSVRTGRSIVHFQDRQMYCLLSGHVRSGHASVLCTVRTGRCIFVWSGQAGVFCMVGTGRRIICIVRMNCCSLQCLGRQLYCVLLCIVRPSYYPEAKSIFSRSGFTYG